VQKFQQLLLPSFPRPDSGVAIAGWHSERSEESPAFCQLPSINTEPFLAYSMWLASAGRRRALFFFLAKRSKSQGLELMLD